MVDPNIYLDPFLTKSQRKAFVQNFKIIQKDIREANLNRTQTVYRSTSTDDIPRLAVSCFQEDRILVVVRAFGTLMEPSTLVVNSSGGQSERINQEDISVFDCCSLESQLNSDRAQQIFTELRNTALTKIKCGGTVVIVADSDQETARDPELNLVLGNAWFSLDLLDPNLLKNQIKYQTQSATSTDQQERPTSNRQTRTL